MASTYTSNHQHVPLSLSISLSLSPVQLPPAHSVHSSHTGGCCTVLPRWTGGSGCPSPSVPVRKQSDSLAHQPRSPALVALYLQEAMLHCIAVTGSCAVQWHNLRIMVVMGTHEAHRSQTCREILREDRRSHGPLMARGLWLDERNALKNQTDDIMHKQQLLRHTSCTYRTMYC